MTRAKRGFASLLVILLLLLVATSLVALGMAFGQEARRTTAAGEEAQLRQLLTAGAIAAAKGERALALPAELQSRGASVTISVVGDTATVSADMGDRHMSQAVRFAKRDGKLTVIEARLTE